MGLHNLVQRSIVRVTKPHSFLTKGRISEGAYGKEDESWSEKKENRSRIDDEKGNAVFV